MEILRDSIRLDLIYYLQKLLIFFLHHLQTITLINVFLVKILSQGLFLQYYSRK